MYIDINECSDASLNDCDDNAHCTNTIGSFNCTCDPGYSGNGITCLGKMNIETSYIECTE